jgi:hypothetical protein
MATVPLAITAVIGQIVNAVYIPIHAGEQGKQADRLQNEENLIRRAGIYALSGWLDEQGRMTDKISCTESH